MKLRHFPILTDQNIHSGVVTYLRGEGFDALDVFQAGLSGATDTAILDRATAEGRIVVTHDSDFGALVISQGLPFIGIVYLRPGHVGPHQTIESLQQLLAVDPEIQIQTPFVIAVKRIGNQVKIRLRSFAPP